MDDLPEGFTRVDVRSAFIIANGPLWMRTSDRRLQLGFRVEPRHANIAGTCHGGMVATFCDMLFTLTARAHSDELRDNFMSTINLHIDFIGAATLGAWVQGEAQILRVTGRMIFVHGLLRVNDAAIVQASAILKVGEALHGTPN